MKLSDLGAGQSKTELAFFSRSNRPNSLGARLRCLILCADILDSKLSYLVKQGLKKNEILLPKSTFLIIDQPIFKSPNMEDCSCTNPFFFFNQLERSKTVCRL